MSKYTDVVCSTNLSIVHQMAWSRSLWAVLGAGHMDIRRHPGMGFEHAGSETREDRCAVRCSLAVGVLGAILIDCANKSVKIDADTRRPVIFPGSLESRPISIRDYNVIHLHRSGDAVLTHVGVHDLPEAFSTTLLSGIRRQLALQPWIPLKSFQRGVH